MTTSQQHLADAIARYAGTFHQVIGDGMIGDGQQVASPLGAWLLLALAGPAAGGEERAALTEVLGVGIDAAAAWAGDLLTEPHPLVAAAAAAWSRPGMADERWLAGLPAVVERGDIPDQLALNDWARRHTLGLIETFPIEVNDLVYLLLASALATKVSWECPFELAPSSELGTSSPWAGRLAQVLRSPDHRSHSAFIAATAQAGDVAVHVAEARDGLAVWSVAAVPDVRRAAVIEVAHELATAHAVGRDVPRRSLFDLPLGDGPIWSLREDRSSSGDVEECVAVLPAWSARSEHDLSDLRLGFAAAAAALGPDDPWEAKQAAMASYSRLGFEAAAVTALAVLLSAPLPQPGWLRTADLRFGHPYAVVAITSDTRTGAGARSRHGPWHGIPVFSAWVTDPHDAMD